MKEYLNLMRVRHYVKNLLIFLPLVFSGKLVDIGLLYKSALGFLVFCFICSCVYILNDIYDIEKDKKHPTKCKRPLAANKVTVRSAYILMIFLLVVSVVILVAIKSSRTADVVIVLYLLLNIAYSKKVKNYPIFDIAILSSGFLLRVLYGSALTGIPTSPWLYLTILSGALYLSLGKRRNEYAGQKDTCREVLSKYSYEFLDKNMYVSLAITIVFYSLWAIGTTTGSKFIWTVPLVIIICMKYNLNIEGSSEGDPVDVILNDKLLIFLVIIYVAAVLALLYL